MPKRLIKIHITESIETNDDEEENVYGVSDSGNAFDESQFDNMTEAIADAEDRQNFYRGQGFETKIVNN